jgi:tRNA pseudouridine55 synthase
LNGVLIIDKPQGWTSHDVVAWVRKVLRIRKVGHGGTLDPLATGVLPIYLGEGTKLVPFNLDGIKEYIATMKLGQETDTLDADGRIIAEMEGFLCTRQTVEEVLNRFRGRIRQRPPLYSAVKQQGVPLYKRARSGETPEVAEREAVVHALLLKGFSFPLVTLEIVCGRGTYIRSLCADMGRALGCGAHLVELRRTRSGRFGLDQAMSLEDLSRWIEEKKIEDKVIPLKNGVDLSGEVRLEEKAAARVRQGQPLRLNDLPEGERRKLRKGQRWGLFQGAHDLVAIAESQVDAGPRLSGDSQALRILRVFQR